MADPDNITGHLPLGRNINDRKLSLIQWLVGVPLLVGFWLFMALMAGYWGWVLLRGLHASLFGDAPAGYPAYTDP